MTDIGRSTERLEDLEFKEATTTPILSNKNIDKNQKKDRKPRFVPQETVTSKTNENVLKRGSENVEKNFKRGNGLIQRVKSAEKDKEKAKESESVKAETEVRKNGMAKNFDNRGKRNPTEDDEAKKIYETSLSSTSLTFGSILSKPMSPSARTANPVKSPLV